MSFKAIQAQVTALANAAKASHSASFFKTGPGQYGHGDVFVGLTNPECRKIAADNKNVTYDVVEELLNSKIHQERFIGLVILENKFKKKENEEDVFQIYMRNLKAVNNWDLVDISAPTMIGKYLFKRCKSFHEITGKDDPRSLLYTLVASNSLWERRISILSTLTFIRNGEFYDSLHLSSILLGDKEDLIHKAVGWMLREVGKRNQPVMQKFLQEHYKDIPRTTLRYAIEKMPEPKRKDYLKGVW